MTTLLTRCFAGLVLVLPFVPGALAQEPDQVKKEEPGEVTDQKEFTKLVVGTWRENRIRPGMKQPQILKFTADGDFEFFIADAKGGRWIKARYEVRSANRIWLDKLTENLDQENRRSIMQLVLTRGEGKRPDTLGWIWPLPEMSGTYERVEHADDPAP
jgi:hypothetical protein